MKYGVYIIEDGGTGTRSMPFLCRSPILSLSGSLPQLFGRFRRPFVGDFKVDCIACYDDFTLEFSSDRRQDSVCTGSDVDIMKMIEIDAPFYQRGNIDRAPVSVSGGDDHE